MDKNVKKYGFESLYWLFLTSLGSLLPIWGSILLLNIFSQKTSLSYYAQNGTLVLYSAAISTSALYIVTKDYLSSLIDKIFSHSKIKTPIKLGFPRQKLFTSISLFVLFVSAILFSGVSISPFINPLYKLNIEFISIVSIVVFSLSFLTSLVISYIDNDASDQSESEIRRSLKSNEEKLSKEFETQESEGKI